MSVRTYKITCDGYEVEIVHLRPEQYETQHGRDQVRKEYAERHAIGTWGVRLTEIGRKYIVWTDMETGVTSRKYVDGTITDINERIDE